MPSAINQMTREMDVGGGTSIAGPCHGEPSNDAFKPLKAICFVMNMQNMQDMQNMLHNNLCCAYSVKRRAYSL